jgi:hypothetical protein
MRLLRILGAEEGEPAAEDAMVERARDRALAVVRAEEDMRDREEAAAVAAMSNGGGGERRNDEQKKP